MNGGQIKGQKTLNTVVFLAIFLSFFEYALRYTSLGGMQLYFEIVVVIFVYSMYKAISNLNYIWAIWIPFYIVALVHCAVYSYSSYYLLMYIATLGFPIIFMNSSEQIIGRIIKIVSYTALFFAIGCIFQKVLESTYLSIVPNLFVNDIKQQILAWNSWDLLSGFSHQPTAAAAAICIGIVTNWIHYGKKTIFIQVILYWALLLTAKRSFLIMSIVVPIMMYYISGSKQGTFSKALLSIAIVGTVLYIFNSLSTKDSGLVVVDRLMKAVESNDMDIATSGRETLMRDAIMLFKTNPFWGVGWGTFSEIYGTSVHNVYVQLLAETGILGLVSFVLPAVITLIRTTLKATRLKGEEKGIVYAIKFSLGIQLLFLIYSFTGNPLYDIQWIYLYFMACAISYVTVIKKTGENNEKNRNTDLSEC